MKQFLVEKVCHTFWYVMAGDEESAVKQAEVQAPYSSTENVICREVSVPDCDHSEAWIDTGGLHCPKCRLNIRWGGKDENGFCHLWIPGRDIR